MVKITWKIKLGLGLVIASVLLYSFAFLFLNEPDKVFFYIIIDSAFVPIDVLVVVLVIESLIGKKEKESVLEKLDMILGVFFSEIGNDLLEMISKVNSHDEEFINELKNIDKWNDKDFKKSYKYLKTNGVAFTPELSDSEVQDFIYDLKSLLNGKRLFLIDLLENPNIIEKNSFADLLLSLFHLDDELELREELDKIDGTDFQHLIGDIDRVYCRLTYEWVKYLQFLNHHYPYMSSLTIRSNPFNPETDVYISD